MKEKNISVQSLKVHYPGYFKFIKNKQILCSSINEHRYTKSVGFLEQTEIEILLNILTKFPNVHIEILKKTENCTKPFVILYGDYAIVDESICVEILYNYKYKKLGHTDVLGAFMNNGVKLNDFGDILVADDGRINLITTKETLSYLIMYITHISNLKVEYKEIFNIDVLPSAKTEFFLIVSSMRIDNIVGSLAHYSRNKAKKYVTDKNVRVNFINVINCSYEVRIGDIISIKKIGRFKILAIDKTRKNKFRVEVI